MSDDFFRKLAKKYSDPVKVQSLLKSLDYNAEPDGETLKSAQATFQSGKAHCLEGAFLAAAILEHKGYPPLVMSIESIDNLDHVVYVYKKKNKWGSIGRSRDQGLHGRKPVFKNIRDLAMSYYEPYVDKSGCVSGYQIVNLDDCGADWCFSPKNVWKVERYLIEIKHFKFKFNKKRYTRLFNNFKKGIKIKKQSFWA